MPYASISTEAESAHLMSSPSSRIAQSRLANAVKNGDSESTVKTLRIKFAVARAIDAVDAIPGVLDDESHDALISAIAEKALTASRRGRHG